jgi:hypothetical protein
MSSWHSHAQDIAAGLPGVPLLHPTDNHRGRMEHASGMKAWVFEMDECSGEEIAQRLVQTGQDLPATRVLAERAKAIAHKKMVAMIAGIL